MSVLSLFALWLGLLQATPVDATVYDNTRVLTADCPNVRVTTVAFLKKIGAHVEPVNGRPDTVSFSTSIKNAQGRASANGLRSIPIWWRGNLAITG